MGKHVGTFLKSLREERGLSQADVAKLLSLKTAQSISNIERGVSPLPRAKIKRLADILGVKKADIVSVVMREMQDRVSKAAGVPARTIVVGSAVSSEDFSVLSSLAARLSDAKANERMMLKRQLRKILDS